MHLYHLTCINPEGVKMLFLELFLVYIKIILFYSRCHSQIGRNPPPSLNFTQPSRRWNVVVLAYFLSVVLRLYTDGLKVSLRDSEDAVGFVPSSQLTIEI